MTTTGRGKRRKRLLAFVLSLSISFALGEVGARALLGSPWPERLPILRVESNPTRGWQMIAGEDHYTYDRLVRVNSLGLRGPEPGPKDEGRLRVLALGDSLVYGQGVHEHETLPAHLERLLTASDEAGRSWEVVNAALRAYDTRQELALLEELGPKLAPDVVVVFWFHNDLVGRDLAATSRRLEESGPIAFDTGDDLEGWNRWKWHLMQQPRRSALLMGLYDGFVRPPTRRGGPPKDPEARYAALGACFDRFLELEREWGFQLFFAVVPFGPALELDEFWGFPLEDRAIELARSKGIPAIRLDEDVRLLARERGGPPVIPFDGHYLGEGNEALARTAARFLLEVL